MEIILIMSSVESFERGGATIIRKTVSFFERKSVVVVMSLAIVLYCMFFADCVPSKVRQMMNTSAGKLVALVIVAYIASKQPIIGILLVAAYIFSINRQSDAEEKKVTFSEAETSAAPVETGVTAAAATTAAAVTTAAAAAATTAAATKPPVPSPAPATLTGAPF